METLEFYKSEVLKKRPKAKSQEWDEIPGYSRGDNKWSIIDRSLQKYHIGNGATELIAWKDCYDNVLKLFD